MYGGGSIGLMGAVAQAAHDAGGHVVGYNPYKNLISLAKICNLMVRRAIHFQRLRSCGNPFGYTKKHFCSNFKKIFQFAIDAQLMLFDWEFRVIPKALMPKEICGNTVGDLVAVDDMHQRKAEMARRADAFIALPGTRISKFLYWDSDDSKFIITKTKMLLASLLCRWVWDI